MVGLSWKPTIRFRLSACPHDPALTAALTAIAAARQVLRARTPGTPAGDADEQHEDNTYNLPEGRPIRRAFKRFARRQLKKILAAVPEIGALLPARIPSLADWSDPMASAMTPLVSLYWDEAGQTPGPAWGWIRTSGRFTTRTYTRSSGSRLSGFVNRRTRRPTRNWGKPSRNSVRNLSTAW